MHWMTTEAAAFTAYLFIEEITPWIGWHISAQLLKVPKRHAFEDENAFVNWLCNLTIRLYRYLLVKIKKKISSVPADAESRFLH